MIDDKYEDIIKQKIEKELSELGSSFESEISEDENKEDEIDVSNNIVKISNSISEILNELVMNNSLKKDNKQKKDIFDTNQLININLFDYIIRIISYSNCEENTLISALIFIDRIAKVKKITKLNVYKLLFTSILISLKYNEDEIYGNDYYSQIAGVSCSELSKMEYEYVILLNFNLFIDEEIFNQYKRALEGLKI
jgi:hypothetical protein